MSDNTEHNIDAYNINGEQNRQEESDIQKWAAFELFGEMRHPTEEEKACYRDMLERISITLDIDIADI